VQTTLQAMSEAIPALDYLRTSFTPPEPEVRFGAATLEHVERIDVQAVTYRYPGTQHDALSDVSVTLRPGEVIGLAGPSGSGKSTLGQILLRLRIPTQGALRVNGVPASDFSKDSWYRRISYVPQQPLLLRGSLFDNVAYFMPGCTRSMVESALQSAGLDTLADELPGGLDCMIGPGHRDLSGGQTQRIGIARALVRSPDVIVLDEPTSALDLQSELAVHEALAQLRRRGDITLVVIAHRESTLAMCDRVLRLHEGRLLNSTEPTTLTRALGSAED
jgi:ATP-binding cassette, subfamily B, bacterial